MKDYPWINFHLDLRKITFSTWLQLGQCVSKCHHLKHVPLTPVIRNKLHSIYLAKGVHATTAIEGNTLTEDQVKDIVDKKHKSVESKRYLEQEVENIIDACRHIAQKIAQHELNEIDVDLLCQFNKTVLHDVPCEEDVIPGQLRKHNIVVGNVYRGPEPPDAKELLGRFCNWMNSDFFNSPQLDSFAQNIIKAVVAHVYIAWIHPFGDGNGRTARLLEFAFLLKCGIPSSASHLLSNHYNTTRAEYYRQLDKAGKIQGDLTDFFAYAVSGFLDGLNEQLEYIYEQIIDIFWQHYIYDDFRKQKSSDMFKRRRNLALAVSRINRPVDKQTILLLMSKEYRGKTEKTLTRDLRYLMEKHIFVEEENGYKANKNLILDFLPFSSS